MRVLMLASAIDTNRSTDGFIADWARALAEKVDALVILTYCYNIQEKFPANTKIIKIRGSNSLTRNIDLVIKTFRYSMGCDVLFAHILEIFGIVAGVVGKTVGKKSFFWYAQGYDLSKHNLAKLALRLPDRIFTSSPESIKFYRRDLGSWIEKKILAIGQGLYIPHYLGGDRVAWPAKKGGDVLVMYAGRLSPIKGVPVLKNAIRLLKKQGKKITLKIVPKFCYSQNQVLFKSANIFVMPTLSRVPDKVYMEALTCGTPTIGSDLAYSFMKKRFPELIFKTDDGVDLANKILWMLNNPQQTELITASAQRYITKNFNAEKLMDRMVTAFKTI